MADAFTPIDPAATSLERSESRRRRRRQQDNGVGAAGELTLVNTPPPVNPSNCSSPALSSARSPSLSPAPDIPPSLLIKSVEITRLTAINENFGTFEAQIFVKCLFVGGADDPHLSAKGVDGNLSTPLFPIGADGRPTFKPNAAWYLDKLIFANMYAHPKAQVKERDNEVRIEGNDLAITIYSEGSFYEKFELHDFPFDAQDLTFELCMNVRVDGPVGCRLEVNRTTHSELLVAGFYLSDCWSLHKHMGGTLLIGCDNHDGGRSGELSEKSIKQGPSNLPAGSCAEPRSKTRAKIRASMAASKSASSNFGAKMSKVMMGRSITKFWGSTVGSSSSDGTKFWGSGSCDEMTEAEAEPTRKFPSAFFTLKVARRYHYYLWNIIMPSFLFVPLAFLQFILPVGDGTRLECSLSLVLTTVLFKFAVVSPDNFPTVNYLTLLDKQVLVSQLMVFWLAFENGAVAGLEYHFPSTGSDSATDVNATGDPRADAFAHAAPGEYFDRLAFIFSAGLFLLMCVYFAVEFRKGHLRGTNLEKVHLQIAEDEEANSARSGSYTKGSPRAKRAERGSKELGAAGLMRKTSVGSAVGQVSAAEGKARTWPTPIKVAAVEPPAKAAVEGPESQSCTWH